MYLHLLYLNKNNFREKNRGRSGLGVLERVPIITAFDSKQLWVPCCRGSFSTSTGQ